MGPVTRMLARTRIVRAAVLDAVSIVIFVAIGREEHDEAEEASSFFEVLAPFAIALAVAWATTKAWRRPFDWRTGVGVWVITVLLGLVVRRTLFDDGTAFAFILVTSAFLGLTIVGWRVLASRIT